MIQVLHRSQQRLVPELPLDDHDVDPLGPQLAGVGMPQPVGMHTLMDPRRPPQLGQLPPQVPLAHRPAAGGHKERLARASAHRVVLGYPHRQRLGPHRVDPYRPRSPALAPQHPYRPALQIHIARPQGQRLGQPKPRPPQQHEQRVVPPVGPRLRAA